MKFTNILGTGKAKIEGIKADFVTIASHQLRTPLSAIKWYIELMLGGKQGPLSAKQKSTLEEMYRASERAINLINDLLDVSRIQDGEIHLAFRKVKVEQVVQEVISDFSTFSKSSEVSLSFELVNGPLPEIETDPDKLKRIIVNLLTNSIKYTPAKGKVKIAMQKLEKEKRVQISVSDTGVGIPKEEQEKVFGQFFRSQKVIKMVPEGTGLGLFISKSLVEAMKGKIWFESIEGQGTTFHFTLPVSRK